MSDEILKSLARHVKNPCLGHRKVNFALFCSKRCQLIDLGEWAAEEKAIQVILLILPWIPISVMNGVSNESSAS